MANSGGWLNPARHAPASTRALRRPSEGWGALRSTGTASTPVAAPKNHKRERAWTGRQTRRGDVVLATSPTNPTQLVFKRVVGLGGDVVDVPHSNGRNFRLTTRRVRVPPGSVWLQGDNARNSTDSRDYGPVPEEMLLGRAMVRVWPLTAFGVVENSMQDAVLVRDGSAAAAA